MRMFSRVAYPLVLFFEHLTKKATGFVDRLFPAGPPDIQIGMNELKAQIGMLRAAKAIGVQQEQIMVQAAKLSTVRLRDIMLPARDIVTLAADAPLTTNLLIAHLDLHTRFPVTERPGDLSAIIGYATFKEMMFLAKTHPDNPSLREITRPIFRLPADMTAYEALRRMVSEHVHLALVSDPVKPSILGMITQEDLFEELVGDIQDEFDRLPRTLVASGRQWVVGGGTYLARLRETFNRPDLGSQLAPEATVSDWILHTLRRNPRGGDALTIDRLAVLVRKIRRNKVTEALIDPAAPPSPPAEA